jgi:hypothetical protein
MIGLGVDNRAGRVGACGPGHHCHPGDLELERTIVTASDSEPSGTASKPSNLNFAGPAASCHQSAGSRVRVYLPGVNIYRLLILACTSLTTTVESTNLATAFENKRINLEDISKENKSSVNTHFVSGREGETDD